jgi:hypothetical protein
LNDDIVSHIIEINKIFSSIKSAVFHNLKFVKDLRKITDETLLNSYCEWLKLQLNKYLEASEKNKHARGPYKKPKGFGLFEEVGITFLVRVEV